MTFDFSLIDTNPGSSRTSPFTPPQGFSGDSKEYIALMRERADQLDLGQQMISAARMARDPAFQVVGQYRDEALYVIGRLA